MGVSSTRHSEQREAARCAPTRTVPPRRAEGGERPTRRARVPRGEIEEARLTVVEDLVDELGQVKAPPAGRHEELGRRDRVERVLGRQADGDLLLVARARDGRGRRAGDGLRLVGRHGGLSGVAKASERGESEGKERERSGGRAERRTSSEAAGCRSFSRQRRPLLARGCSLRTATDRSQVRSERNHNDKKPERVRLWRGRTRGSSCSSRGSRSLLRARRRKDLSA